MERQNINLSPEVIQRAAGYGAELLSTKGAIQVDTTVALTGDIQVLHIILSNLANGSVILARPEPPAVKIPQPGQDGQTPGGEDDRPDQE